MSGVNLNRRNALFLWTKIQREVWDTAADILIVLRLARDEVIYLCRSLLISATLATTNISHLNAFDPAHACSSGNP